MIVKQFFIEPEVLTATQLVEALKPLLQPALRFYQQSALLTDSGNLRRQFNTVAQLHQQMLNLRPESRPLNVVVTVPELAELCDWYQMATHFTPEKLCLQSIQLHLSKQLQLQKLLIRACAASPEKVRLLHFTASLQIAADQLAISANFV